MPENPIDQEPGDPEARAVADGVGPLLFLHGCDGRRLRLTALLVRPVEATAPVVDTPDGRAEARCVLERDGWRAWLCGFPLDLDATTSYRVDGTPYPVDTRFGETPRVAYVSCNGQEHGDRDRPAHERNALWRRMTRQHQARPFNLLLHGGDQLYADEVVEAHPDVAAWTTASGAPGAPASDPRTLADALRGALLRRYLELYSQPEIAWMMARVPSLSMWDDHDICDGWGSLHPAKLESPVSRAVFTAARELFLLFQLGSGADEPPPPVIDPAGSSLSWHLRLPGLDVIAPDLRSERRPDRVMGEAGWTALERALAASDAERLLLLSSVPALGPRLSWVEAAMRLTPRAEQYEDDLRDQWQSRAHRAEWRRFLEALSGHHRFNGPRVTVLSGEIHLATRGTLTTPCGPLHQLVASGIAHPPPPVWYARALSALARLGEAPLPGRPIRLHPLPGQPAIYTPQRNYLVLERRARRWRAWWELDDDGSTAPLDLD